MAAGAAPALAGASRRCNGIEPATPEQITWLLGSFRRRQWQGGTGSSFLELVPCDLYKLLAGRSLWLIGDSQLYYFYVQLSCFLAPFVERRPPGNSGNSTAATGGGAAAGGHGVGRHREDLLSALGPTLSAARHPLLAAYSQELTKWRLCTYLVSLCTWVR